MKNNINTLSLIIKGVEIRKKKIMKYIAFKQGVKVGETQISQKICGTL